MSTTDAAPQKTLAYLYCGSVDIDRDLAFYVDGLHGELLWRLEDSGTTVAAVSLGADPAILLASHRPAPSVLPIWLVPGVDEAAGALKGSGWNGSEHRVELPDGPCLVLTDASGNEIALLERTRPGVVAAMTENFRNRNAQAPGTGE